LNIPKTPKGLSNRITVLWIGGKTIGNEFEIRVSVLVEEEISRWNFKHINNAEKKLAISKVVESFGFVCPQLCSPEELGDAPND